MRLSEPEDDDHHEEGTSSPHNSCGPPPRHGRDGGEQRRGSHSGADGCRGAGEDSTDEDALLAAFEERCLSDNGFPERTMAGALKTGPKDAVHAAAGSGDSVDAAGLVNEGVAVQRDVEEEAGPMTHVLLLGAPAPATAGLPGEAAAASALGLLLMPTEPAGPVEGEGEEGASTTIVSDGEQEGLAAVAEEARRFEAEQEELLLQQLAAKLLRDCRHDAAHNMDRRALPPSLFQ